MEPVDDLIEYFEYEARKKADKGFLSERIRKFTREYYTRTRKSRVIVWALYNAYTESTNETVKESYFRGVIEKAWITDVDNDTGIQYVDLSKQKKLRLRKRKV